MCGQKAEPIEHVVLKCGGLGGEKQISVKEALGFELDN